MGETQDDLTIAEVGRRLTAIEKHLQDLVNRPNCPAPGTCLILREHLRATDQRIIRNEGEIVALFKLTTKQAGITNRWVGALAVLTMVLTLFSPSIRAMFGFE